MMSPVLGDLARARRRPTPARWPKSKTLIIPFLRMRTLSGLRSRCTTPRPRARRRGTSRSWSPMSSTSMSASVPRRFRRASRVSPSRSSITRNAAPSSVTSSSSTRRGAGLIDLVGEVRLAHEALDETVVARQVLVQDLERAAHAVAVRAGVDGGHQSRRSRTRRRATCRGSSCRPMPAKRSRPSVTGWSLPKRRPVRARIRVTEGAGGPVHGRRVRASSTSGGESWFGSANAARK